MAITEAPLPVAREVTEVLAAADASTWFVWTQHHTPVRTVGRGTNAALRDRLLPRLLDGTTLAGVAFTHLRRPGPPAVAARRDGNAWVLDGEIAWLTSWELADVFCVGAQTGDDVVWLLVPLRGRPGVAAESLDLAAMAGTSTMRVRLSEVRVSDDDVALVEPLDAWRALDATRTADVSPAVFGVTAEAVRRLWERDDEAARAVADSVETELTSLRMSAYELADDVPAGRRVDERLKLRARAHLLSCRATTALVALGAGRSMLLDSPAQRLARVALFLLVQGQTVDVRRATLQALAQQ
jgi:alkylation response protein AidB-like acyl-CoA dehydrogenase